MLRISSTIVTKTTTTKHVQSHFVRSSRQRKRNPIRKLISKYGFKHLSTGDLLRSEIANQTQLGLEAKSYMDKGQLVPDAVVIGMVDAALNANKGVSGFLFDGFPRTKAQAVALDELLATHNTSINLVLALDVPEDELIKRMINRAKTSGRTDDADETVQQKRIAVYKSETLAVAEHYNQYGKSGNVEWARRD